MNAIFTKHYDTILQQIDQVDPQQYGKNRNLIQTETFLPESLTGRMYWKSIPNPKHGIVFNKKEVKI